MTEQQYRVIADRDKGDDPTWADVSKGDRYFAESRHEYDWDLDRILRIERPVPTTDEMMSEFGIREHIGPDGSNYTVPSPHPPTREQIAEAIYRANGETAGPDWNRVASSVKTRYRDLADAVLVLIQNGADR